MKTITLAFGQITAADILTIELMQAVETPPVVLLHWPGAPSVCDPVRFGATGTAIVAILAEARVALAKAMAGEL